MDINRCRFEEFIVAGKNIVVFPDLIKRVGKALDEEKRYGNMRKTPNLTRTEVRSLKRRREEKIDTFNRRLSFFTPEQGSSRSRQYDDIDDQHERGERALTRTEKEVLKKVKRKLEERRGLPALAPQRMTRESSEEWERNIRLPPERTSALPQNHRREERTQELRRPYDVAVQLRTRESREKAERIARPAAEQTSVLPQTHGSLRPTLPFVHKIATSSVELTVQDPENNNQAEMIFKDNPFSRAKPSSSRKDADLSNRTRRLDLDDVSEISTPSVQTANQMTDSQLAPMIFDREPKDEPLDSEDGSRTPTYSPTLRNFPSQPSHLFPGHSYSGGVPAYVPLVDLTSDNEKESDADILLVYDAIEGRPDKNWTTFTPEEIKTIRVKTEPPSSVKRTPQGEIIQESYEERASGIEPSRPRSVETSQRGKPKSVGRTRSAVDSDEDYEEPVPKRKKKKRTQGETQSASPEPTSTVRGFQTRHRAQKEKEAAEKKKKEEAYRAHLERVKAKKEADQKKKAFLLNSCTVLKETMLNLYGPEYREIVEAIDFSKWTLSSPTSRRCYKCAGRWFKVVRYWEEHEEEADWKPALACYSFPCNNVVIKDFKVAPVGSQFGAPTKRAIQYGLDDFWNYGEENTVTNRQNQIFLLDYRTDLGQWRSGPFKKLVEDARGYTPIVGQTELVRIIGFPITLNYWRRPKMYKDAVQYADDGRKVSKKIILNGRTAEELRKLAEPPEGWEKWVIPGFNLSNGQVTKTDKTFYFNTKPPKKLPILRLYPVSDLPCCSKNC